jgi:hypothetical protein
MYSTVVFLLLEMQGFCLFGDNFICLGKLKFGFLIFISYFFNVGVVWSALKGGLGAAPRVGGGLGWREGSKKK